MSKYQTLYKHLTLRRAKKAHWYYSCIISDLIDQKTYSKDSLHTHCSVFIDCTLDDSISDVHPSNKFRGVLSYLVNDLHSPDHENINGWTLRVLVLKQAARKNLLLLSKLGD